MWREMYDVNLFIPAVLNAVVMNMFDKNIKKTVINITSLYGIQAGQCLGQYCSVKAAREMYFKVYIDVCMHIYIYVYLNILCIFKKQS